MATYFHGSSEIQAAAAAPEGLQTLYLMNPNNYVPYSSDTQQQRQNNNMLFLNPATLPHAPPPHNEHFIGIPLPHPTTTVGSTNSEDPSRPSLHEISELHPIPPRIYYNLWGSVDQTGSTNSGGGAAVEAVSQMGFRGQGGLSLSLSPKQIRPPSQLPAISARDEIDEIGMSGNSSSPVSNGISKQSYNLGLKYLKAVQELLDEVVNVDLVEGNKQKAKVNREASSAAGEGSSGWNGVGGGKCGVELTAAQRQEVQMKKSKLTKMLDEVEQRYKQYHHQMQFVVASFEQAAGLNSAKSYTALALQTISKQFRCLKEAISAQIKSANRSLGEETVLGAKVEGSRLRYVDHQLRQQRTLQQLGMPAQHNAWRPQRGLPERAVSVLRAWLFEHFLHPYPKDSDKVMLAKQTGLARSQVSNWFINARVRLWKPMVEEMYSEEIKDKEPNGSLLNNTNKTNHNKNMASNSTALQDSSAITLDQIKSLRRKQDKSSNQNTSPTEISNSTMSTSAMGASLQAHQSFNLIRPSDIEGIAQKSPKKRRSPDMQNSPISILSMEMDTKHGHPTNHVGGSGFGAYPTGDMGPLAPRFHGNGVSLTLGLPQLSGTQQSYISNQNIEFGRRIEMGISGEPDFCGINVPQSNDFENFNIQNRKKFAAQLLPDFVT